MKELYNSWLIIPMLPWLTAPIVLLLGLRARGVMGWLVAAFSVEIALDAWLTGPLSPIHVSPEWDWVIPVVFVILGDLRYFAMIETRSVLRPVVLAFIVPVSTQFARVAFRRVHDDPAVNYLVYELAFLALALVFRFWVVPKWHAAGPPRRREEGGRVPSSSPPPRTWGRSGGGLGEAGSPTWGRSGGGLGAAGALRLTEFEIVQYGLWACADVILLSGHLSGLGWALRIVPNVLYYVAFLPFALWLSAAERRTQTPP